MQTIKLMKELFQSVKAENKVATTRLGIKKIHLGQAKFVDPANPNNTINIIIKELYLCEFGDLDCMEYDLAEAENYNSHAEFEIALKGIYGEIDCDQYMTVVYFDLDIQGEK